MTHRAGGSPGNGGSVGAGLQGMKGSIDVRDLPDDLDQPPLRSAIARTLVAP